MGITLRHSYTHCNIYLRRYKHTLLESYWIQTKYKEEKLFYESHNFLYQLND